MIEHVFFTLALLFLLVDISGLDDLNNTTKLSNLQCIFYQLSTVCANFIGVVWNNASTYLRPPV